jgi:mono/diheme cytochrome c family protein
MRMDSSRLNSTDRPRSVLVYAAALAALWVGFAGGAVPPGSHAEPDMLAATPVQAAPTPGAGVYNQYCAVCHQSDGKGTPGVFPPLAGSPVVMGDPHYLARLVLYGLGGRIAVGGQTYSGNMAGLGKNMNDAQIAQALTYIRSTWGNNAEAVGEDVVKAERALPGTPQDNGAKYPK